jgi:hypothetical protein
MNEDGPCSLQMAACASFCVAFEACASFCVKGANANRQSSMITAVTRDFTPLPQPATALR